MQRESNTMKTTSRGRNSLTRWIERATRFVRWLAAGDTLPDVEKPPPRRPRPSGGVRWLFASERLPIASNNDASETLRPPNPVRWLLSTETLPVAAPTGDDGGRTGSLVRWLVAPETLDRLPPAEGSVTQED